MHHPPMFNRNGWYIPSKNLKVSDLGLTTLVVCMILHPGNLCYSFFLKPWSQGRPWQYRKMQPTLTLCMSRSGSHCRSAGFQQVKTPLVEIHLISFNIICIHLFLVSTLHNITYSYFTLDAPQIFKRFKLRCKPCLLLPFQDTSASTETKSEDGVRPSDPNLHH